MFNINIYLNKFKDIIPPDKFIKDEFVSTVKSVVGVVIKKDDINIINGNVFVSTDPIVKNEIFLKKRNVISELKERLKNHKKTIKNVV